MAGIVYISDIEKISFAEAAYATVSDGHLFVYENGGHQPNNVLATFAPGKWARFVRDGSAVRSKNGHHAALSVDAVPAS
ncbi:hypothetical protein SAMN02799641_03017 [Rhodococcus erythropolis]|jgi:hypothetical protein|uniref:hypothetical protein n=1 Tax=Rhodococcus erythropolis group TaxID=2840174 RepID=UPI0008766252|nr:MULTISPECIES: hypothetical protein [Rhodococcus erythropolis group]MBW4816106.1 hypothetical protein [Rhodococcus qingshengii]SCY78754.1 hypothetical protein SAMN02799641_03017 [Rhodococcus erythropolis]